MVTTKTTTKKRSSTSGADLLASLASLTAKATKSKTPVVDVTDPIEVQQMVAIIDAKRKEKAAESASTSAQSGFRGRATELFEAQCISDDSLHSSIKLNATTGKGAKAETRSLTFTQVSKCKNMTKDPETVDGLRSVFGTDFDKYFGEQQTVTIDTSKLEDLQVASVIKAIQKALNFAADPKDFNAAIGVIATIEPKEAFFRDRILNTDFRKLARHAKTDGLAVPYSPSFKL